MSKEIKELEFQTTAAVTALAVAVAKLCKTPLIKQNRIHIGVLRNDSKNTLLA